MANLHPSAMVAGAGGKFQEGPFRMMNPRFQYAQYKNKAGQIVATPAVFAFDLEAADENGEVYTELKEYTMGGLKPSEDEVNPTDVGSKTCGGNLNESTNFAFLVKELYNTCPERMAEMYPEGFVDVSLLSEACFVGKSVPQPKRDNMPQRQGVGGQPQSQSTAPRTFIMPIEPLETVPWLETASAPKAKATPAKVTPAKAAPAPAAAAKVAPKPAVASAKAIDPAAVAVDVFTKVLELEGGSIEVGRISKAVFDYIEQHDKAKIPQRSAIIKACRDAAFLEAGGAWSIEDNVVTAG